jgi:DNA-binding transcriptional ArsR family regulator
MLHWQNTKKEDSREKIFRLLMEQPLTWTELLEKTGFSSETLKRHLDSLRESKVIEKQLVFGEKDRVVYTLSKNPEKLLQEFNSVAFDMTLEYLHDFQPSVYIFVKAFMIALLRTKLQAQLVKIDVNGALLNNLDNAITPEDANTLGLPDGVKLSTWVLPYFQRAS